MPTTRYILDPAEVGGRLTVILDAIRGFIERHRSVWGRFYCLLYGSYAYRVVHQASDIDLVIVADCLSRDDKIELIALVEKLHRHLGADLDHEIPYEKKISITINDMERAVTGESLRSAIEHPFPKIMKSPEVLSSRDLLDRFFCGMLLHPHIFVAGLHDLYMRHRSRATQSIIAIAREAIGSESASVDELISVLCEYEGNTGDTHLGFEKCEPFISHLKETLPLMLNRGREDNPAGAEGNAGHALVDVPQPVFVLGCPRSGTTMLGHLLGTCDGMVNAQELSALYFTHCMTDQEYANVPSPFKAQYIASVRQHAQQFYGEIVSTKPFRYVIETTPWNLRIAEKLLTQFPTALFILCYRNPGDVVESLRKSYDLGYSWAGPSDTLRCALWSDLYGKALCLDEARTFCFNYDDFCEDPPHWIRRLENWLSNMGVANVKLDPVVLTQSYVTDAPRSRAEIVGDRVSMKKVRAFPMEDLSPSRRELISSITGEIVEALRRKFGAAIH